MTLYHKKSAGFTLIELVMVIVIIGILVAFVLPRFANLGGSARQSVVEGIGGSMRSTISIIRSKARATGLSPAASNPGNNNQSGFLVETDAGLSEVDWRNLCPESRAEVGDALSMPDHLALEVGGSDLIVEVTNQTTRVGYDLGANGCFANYDSFACEVTTTVAGC